MLMFAGADVDAQCFSEGMMPSHLAVVGHNAAAELSIFEPHRSPQRLLLAEGRCLRQGARRRKSSESRVVETRVVSVFSFELESIGAKSAILGCRPSPGRFGLRRSQEM